MSTLNQAGIEKRFTELPLEWSLVGGTQLEKSSSFEDFAQALTYVNAVGALAEKHNHHPDIHLSYGKADVIITTHSEGGLTDKDFDLAEAIEKIKS